VWSKMLKTLSKKLSIPSELDFETHYM